MIASQKMGTDTPAKETTRVTWSTGLFRRVPEITPSGIPMITAIAIATVVSSNVAGKNLVTASDTGRFADREYPRSPVTTPPSHLTYWTQIGWSKP